jgi:CubicO group peptidase (beta-lactamase class C family)
MARWIKLALLLALTPCVLRAQTADESAHIRNIEQNTAVISDANIRLSLPELLAAMKVPGVSVAVIHDFKLAWAQGFGVIEAGSPKPVTTKTLFQAGSISKPVAATAALKLVEEGKLSLDEPVNVKLKTWQLPDNEFTVKEKVTLRRLLSHTGGLTVHGFPGYDIDEARPTMVQILNGEKPANTAAVRVVMAPGTKFEYSGGGITIEQLLMMDVTGRQFPQLLREKVLDKVGMADSSYEQPLPAERAANTAGGTRSDGKLLHGRWHIYPEMAAAGLWTTPTDLAHFAIEIAQSRNGKSNKILSQKTTTEMLTPVLDQSGLGFFMDKKKPSIFGHNGADEGFQAILTMDYQTGDGAVIMADSDNGIALGDYVLRAIAREYKWDRYFEDPFMADLTLIAIVKGVPAALQRYDAQKKATNVPAESKVQEHTLNGLGYTFLQRGQIAEAITVFTRNTVEYPESGNVWDSLGEAYAAAGDKAAAIKNYEKSLQVDPKNENAKKWLEKLKAQ